MTDNNAPNLKVTGTSRKNAKVFLHCSNLQCEVVLREIKPHQSIDVTRAYHCRECQPENVITINPPINRTTESKGDQSC